MDPRILDLCFNPNENRIIYHLAIDNYKQLIKNKKGRGSIVIHKKKFPLFFEMTKYILEFTSKIFRYNIINVMSTEIIPLKDLLEIQYYLEPLDLDDRQSPQKNCSVTTIACSIQMFDMAILYYYLSHTLHYKMVIDTESYDDLIEKFTKEALLEEFTSVYPSTLKQVSLFCKTMVAIFLIKD